MKNFERNLEKYAEIAVNIDLNIQKGQEMILSASLDSAPLVRKIVEKAYEAGAKNIIVEWDDDQVTLTKYKCAPDEAFEQFPEWKANGYEEMAKNGAAFLSVGAPNPDLLSDVDPGRIGNWRKTAAIAMKEFRNHVMSGKVNWSGVVTPSKDWAKKLFPDLNEDEAIDKLWEYIFKITRADMDDPVKAWKDHGNNLKKRLDYLNGKKYKKLIYKGEGTDLTIELPDNHIWIGGGSTTEDGIFFVPNIPTEEVFTAPLRDGVNGTVTSTMPLNYGSTLIENFSFTFEKGKVVNFNAEKGYDTLKKMLETDEGALYLGEVALVPNDSPISNTGIVFYNTMYDENASCHLALGNFYPSCVEGGTKMNADDFKNNNLNTSLIHVDFMMGSAALNIDGVTADGKLEPVFRDGNWAI